MIVYVFSAPVQFRGQPQQFQAGDVTAIAIACPDGTSVEQARQFVRQSGVTQHMQGRIQFAHVALPDPLGAPRVLLTQQIQAPALARAGQGAMPTGVPVAQPGQQASPVDPQSGFQSLGEEALAGGQESMYGAVDDHTNQDIIDGQEVPRQVPQQGDWP